MGGGSVGLMNVRTWCLFVNFCCLLVANALIPRSSACMPTFPEWVLLCWSANMKDHLCCLLLLDMGM